MIIKTNELKQDQHLGDLQLQVYNGLDTMITLEVFNKIAAERQLDFTRNTPAHSIYDFERALQAPALEMMLRGIKIDGYEREKAAALIRNQIGRLADILDRYVEAIRGTKLQPRPARFAHMACRYTFPGSKTQLEEFFYRVMKLPEQWKYTKGQRKLSMDRETLEKLQVYWHAQPVILCVLKIRELGDMLEVIETEIDHDGRWRQSYNIAGTDTGRASSSASSTGTGSNAMNITPELRNMFISDIGYKLIAIDFEQSEARDLGWWCWILFGDSTYLDACESGDLHTAVARMSLKHLPWTGDNKKDREIAEQPFYRGDSIRQANKVLGHGSNYLGSPYTMSKHTHIPQKMIEKFQHDYFGAFPCLPRLHRWVAQELQTKQQITSFCGRTRHFFGRPTDDTTLREAVANMGQSPTADRTSLVMWRIWKHCRKAQLLHEVYDAVYCQTRESDEQEVVEQIKSLARVELTHNGRKFLVPVEVKTGWNWGNYEAKSNPNGLKKFNGVDTRKRAEGLDRVL